MCRDKKGFVSAVSFPGISSETPASQLPVVVPEEPESNKLIIQESQ